MTDRQGGPNELACDLVLAGGVTVVVHRTAFAVPDGLTISGAIRGSGPVTKIGERSGRCRWSTARRRSPASSSATSPPTKSSGADAAWEKYSRDHGLDQQRFKGDLKKLRVRFESIASERS